jgi:tetratricopeptide (TPR) repeat protein
MLMLSTATRLRNETWRSDLALWEDTVAKSPTQYLAWNNLGLARWEAGDAEGALAALRRSLEIEPLYFDSRSNLAGMLVRLNRWADCLAVTCVVDEPSLHSPRFSDLLYNQAVALAGLGRLDESAKDLERVVSYRPDFYVAVRLLGVLHHKQAHLRRARLYLSQAEALQPGDPVVTSLLASLDGDPARP